MLVVEVAIERADRDAGALGDLGRADRVVAELAEQLGRGVEQRLVAAARALLAKLRLAMAAVRSASGIARGSGARRAIVLPECT